MNKQINKNKLIKNKYISLYFGLSPTTFTAWNNRNQSNRVAALKQYYINIINRIDQETILLYINDLDLFSNELKNNTIQKKFDIVL